MSLSVTEPKSQMMTNFGAMVEISEAKVGVNARRDNFEFEVKRRDYSTSYTIKGSLKGNVVKIKVSSSAPNNAGYFFIYTYDLKSKVLSTDSREGKYFYPPKHGQNKSNKEKITQMLQQALDINSNMNSTNKIAGKQKKANDRTIKIILEKLKNDSAHSNNSENKRNNDEFWRTFKRILMWK